jgi:hypothetical protein
MVAHGWCHVLTTLAFATPSRRAPDVPRMQPSPLLLPDRVGQQLQRSRQLPQHLEQLDPAPLPTDAQPPTSDDASDAPSAPEAAVVDLWTYQAEGGVAASSKRPCSQPHGHAAKHRSRGPPACPRLPSGPERSPSPLGCGSRGVHPGQPSPWPCRRAVGRGGQPIAACTLAAVRARSAGRRVRAPLHARAAAARQPRHAAP